MDGEWPPDRLKPAVLTTAIKRFRDCERAWALHYHHDAIRDIGQRFAFKREHQLIDLNVYAGIDFHDALDIGLRSCAGSRFPSRDYMAAAVQVARDYIDYSRRWAEAAKAFPNAPKKWPKHGYAQPLSCFYYEAGFPKGFAPGVKAKLEKWFESFQSLWDRLPFTGIDRSHWVFPKTLNGSPPPWFAHENRFAVYANFDFLSTAPGGEVVIYDWKTGSRERGAESASEQLLTYGAWAVASRGRAAENVRLMAVWLDDASVQEVSFDEAELDRIAGVWQDYHAVWKVRLDQAGSDADKLFDLFPMVAASPRCRYCCFRSCPGRLRHVPAQSDCDPDFGCDQDEM